MSSKPFGRVAWVAVLVFTFAGAAVAVDVPYPPPQNGAERQAYNDLLIFDGSGGVSNCCGGQGQNGTPNGQVGCDDPTCQQTVCGFDPFCCETEWDFICVNEALEYCTVCGGGSALAIPAASNWGLAALAGALLAGGLALLAWRRQKSS